jgi:manganese/zinc/iron transport system permease protein
MLSLFTDAVLRAPTIGCMLMSMAASMVGVIALLQKRALLGESLSHAAYPGVTVAVILAAFLFPGESSVLAICILVGAFFSCLLGLWLIDFLQRRYKVRSDSALCLILSACFGVGLTLASQLQTTHPQEYKQVQVYLYGQAATMTDQNIFIYGVLSLMVIGMILLLYKELQALTFDAGYAFSIGVPVKRIQALVYILIVLAVVVGIRSVGVVLMSAMLIAPAVAARQCTNRLSTTLIYAAIFGLASGYFGNYFSITFSEYFADIFPNQRISLPTGPMIVLTAAGLCLFAIFFAPEKGLVVRFFRICLFRHKCLQENLLKTFWRQQQGAPLTLSALAHFHHSSKMYLWWLLRTLYRDGWLLKQGKGQYRLSSDGRLRAAHIVRLHRLWEVYLVNYLGVGAERVHCNAEEIEHILTPTIEKELTELLANPQQDPHQQPIPSKEAIL